MPSNAIAFPEQTPRIGMLATVRNRRGIITSVDAAPALTGAGPNHLVTIEYIDPDGAPDDTLIWQLEPGATLLQPTALPDLISTKPMPPDQLDALVRASRWTAMMPYLDPDGEDGPLSRLPIASPFHGAIQVDDFQLVPLLKALKMPRIALLLADDVGLGKTIEAGLILTELILRRRIRRILILCPASLRGQWQQEMKDKFSLNFDIVDRDTTHQLRKEQGMDASPWRSYSRVITSYHYLKQPDVLEQFMAASTVPEETPHLPWDLIIVDEVHNLAPAPFGEDSDLTNMLRHLAPKFEHRLFLSATPHNGWTRSFTGILEMLDPVRFTQTSELSDRERLRVEDVLVRRLKREINERASPKRFCERHLDGLPLRLSPGERSLSAAFAEFKKKVQSLIAGAQRKEQLAGAFAVQILGKRLLSCPYTFSNSWQRYKAGLGEAEPAAAEEVAAAERAANEDTGSDQEAESRVASAAHVVGAWLKPMAAQLESETAAVDAALIALGLVEDSSPHSDARFEALCALIETHLQNDRGDWLPDERLIVFTEYKTTLDYLLNRIQQRYTETNRILTLSGGMNEEQRRTVRNRFNDPRDTVRILLGTDAAAEGINLQDTARYLLHFDVPFNPSRLEQRNGRLDRHGQARDVTVYHFTTQDDADLKFLAHVVSKVHTVREDLGSAGQVFDDAFQRRFVKNESGDLVVSALDAGISSVSGRADVPRDRAISTDESSGKLEKERMLALAAELDLDAESLKQTLDVALGIGAAQQTSWIGPADERGRFRLSAQLPRAWQALVDDCLRIESTRGRPGAIPSIVFDPGHFIQTINGRLVFRPEKDTALLHLAHPVFHRALNAFARARFPGSGGVSDATRWTVRTGGIPKGADAMLLLTVEEIAANTLRETFHHWVRTYEIPVKYGSLGIALPHRPAIELRRPYQRPTESDVTRAREVWDDVSRDVRSLVRELEKQLTSGLAAALTIDRDEALARETQRFRSRQGELTKLIQDQTLQRLEREIKELTEMKAQKVLFDNDDRVAEAALSLRAKEEELARRKARYQVVSQQLAAERKRVIEDILPKRYALPGMAQVLPVAIEIRLSEIRK